MGKQGKNILNTTKSNMTPTKTSGSITARFEHPNTDEAEEHDLKITLGECLRLLNRK